MTTPLSLAAHLLQDALDAAPALRELAATTDPDVALALSRSRAATVVIESPPAALLARFARARLPLVALYPDGEPPTVDGVERWYPADGVELAVAWSQAVAHAGPTAIVLPSCLPPILDRPAPLRLEDVAGGAYLAADAPADTDAAPITIVASGVELPAALELRRELAAVRVGLRVVAVPSPQRHAARSPVARAAA